MLTYELVFGAYSNTRTVLTQGVLGTTLVSIVGVAPARRGGGAWAGVQWGGGGAWAGV